MINPELKKIIANLQAVVWDGFRDTPYVDKADGVFRSHFDWHSSVHAHWTLLSSSRFLSETESARKILARFSDSAVGAEQERLNRNPSFELPYGQAWLLLLLSEIEKNQQPTVALRRLKSETIARVADWLSNNEFPETNVSSYHSWMIAYFLWKKSKSDLGRPVASALDSKFNRVASVRDENDPKDFFSSQSLFQILRNEKKPLEKLIPQLDLLRPIQQSNCHQLGKLVSRSWASPQNRADSLKEAIQFTQEFQKHPDLWREPFKTISHWIPQYLWVGIWLALGEP